MPIDLVETLRQLIAIPSVNPMGRPVSGPEFYETRLTESLEGFFERMGIPWQRQTVEPGRDNIFARLEGDVPADQGGPLLLWEVHQDTVPVDGMTIPAFSPQIREGRVYGRGSCDVKGGMAAMLVALARLAEDRPPGMPTVVLACTVNEECGFTGAAALAELWAPGSQSLFARRPDAAIVAEPTLLDVVVAHKGMARWKCHTRGRAAHSAQPHLGRNAIYSMGRVVQAIERYAAEVLPTFEPHPLCGRPTVCVSTISGGISVNTVPDWVTVEIDRRLLPGENPLAAQQHLIDYVAAQVGPEDQVEHEPAFRAAGGLSDRENGPLAEGLVRVADEVCPGRRSVGVPYGTDASVISAAGVPTVVFGPGSIDQAHTADEWLDLNQLERASEIYYRFARTFTGGRSSR